MDPEEAAMAVLRHAFTPGLAGVLPQVLADHGLSDGLYHARICRARRQSICSKRRAAWDVEALVNLRGERRQ
jgi:hypothetical protein